MAQFALKVSAGNNWVDLKTKRFSRILVNTLESTSSTVDLVVGRDTLADTSDSVNPTEGNYIFRDVVIPKGATLCFEDLDVSNFKQKPGSNKNDNYTILVRSSSGASHFFITIS